MHIVSRALALVAYPARTQLKEHTGARRAARTTVEPENEWVIGGIRAALKQDKPQMGIVADIEIALDLLNAWITKWRRGLFVFHRNT